MCVSHCQSRILQKLFNELLDRQSAFSSLYQNKQGQSSQTTPVS